MELKNYNEGQKKLILNKDGIVRCQASAGSGKTYALIGRIQNMLESGINPNKIMCCTFTKTAGEEIKERLKKACPFVDIDSITIGTIHSIMYSILRKELKNVDDDFQKIKLLMGVKHLQFFEKIYIDSGLGRKNGKNEKEALKIISTLKYNKITPDKFNYMINNNNDIPFDWVYELYSEYEESKRKNSYIDFDDMIFRTYEILRDNKEILSKYQDKWDYIHVDEFQDTNRLQYDILKMLVEKNNNLCVVGDTRQSLYRFQGAEPEIMENMHNDFISITDIELNVTYRCCNKIVDKSNLLSRLMGNKDSKSIKKGGEVIYLGQFLDKGQESYEVAKKCKELIESECEPKDIKILCRLNSQSGIFEESLQELKLPYVVVGGSSFWEKREIKDILNYLRIVKNPDNSDFAWRSILNRPARFLTKSFVSQWENFCHLGQGRLDSLLSNYESRKHAEKARDLYYQINSLLNVKNVSVGKLIRYILNVTGYKKWFTGQQIDSGDDVKSDNLSALIQLAQIGDKFYSITDFINHIDKLNKKAKEKQKEKNAIQLMTIHKSKGLEAKNVFIISCNDKILPHKESKVDHERNLMYVAITRAINKVFLSSITGKGTRIYQPSEFLTELEIFDKEEVVNE